MHVFIDATILVGFFDTAPGTLVDLEKLVTVLDTGRATLWLPENTKREFWKNRERNIRKAVVDFEQHRAMGKPPLLAREQPAFKQFAAACEAVEQQRRNIAALVKAEVQEQSTTADKIIRDLFERARAINTDDEAIFTQGWRRALCHLPPGSKADIGDRLAWVGLLTCLPKAADLHIVSDDTDYRNEGFTDDIRPYLQAEWSTKNGGSVRLWHRISQFLADNFPDAANARDLERSIVAQELRQSRSFATTHATITRLERLGDFTDEQLRCLAEALVENNQVRNIRRDPDVARFYKNMLSKYSQHIDAALKSQIEELLRDDQ